jgi:SAM-dependent methyltransferase
MADLSRERGLSEARSAHDHWQSVWESADPERVSWFRARPAASLSLIEEARIGESSGIIDVGGGASRLVDHLLDAGYGDLTVLDISSRALDHARARLEHRSDRVRWIEADVRTFDPRRTWDVWHDRAVFHFLTVARDRALYGDSLRRSLVGGGHAILATFGPDGPTRCSGLDVRRYSADALSDEMGPDLELRETRLVIHTTPSGEDQQFVYALFRRPG